MNSLPKWGRRPSSDVRWLFAATLLLLLNACTHIPPARELSAEEIARIPDAVPRHEPRSKYGNPPFYDEFGKRYYLLPDSRGFVEEGKASWYGGHFHGRRTSSGETYDMYAMTAAHKTLPIPAYARVTNRANGRSVVVKLNDRGPFVDGRIVDLSYVAAAKIGMIGPGTADVILQVLEPEGALPPVFAGAPAAVAPPQELAYAIGEVVPARAAVISAQPSGVSEASGATGGGIARAASAAPAKGIYLQLAAYSSDQVAQVERAKLSALQQHPVLIEHVPASGRLLYRVKIGPVEDEQAALALAQQLRSRGYVQSHIVRR